MISQNYSYANALCARNFGGITAPNYFLKPNVIHSRNVRNEYDTNAQPLIIRDSIPTGTEQPYVYILSIKGATLSSSTTINGSGILSAGLTMGKNCEAALTGSGDLVASMSLISSLVANLVGSGQLTGTMNAVAQLTAALSGSGSVTAGLNLIANIAAGLTGSGTLTGDLKGKANLVANIYVNVSEATVQQLVNGVWDAITSDHNNPNTMGEIMNNLGAVADPWSITLPGSYAPGEAGYILGNILTTIPDAVWDELKTAHTTGSSYGKIVQDLELLAKQIKALTSANL